MNFKHSSTDKKFESLSLIRLSVLTCLDSICISMDHVKELEGKLASKIASVSTEICRLYNHGRLVVVFGL